MESWRRLSNDGVRGGQHMVSVYQYATNRVPPQVSRLVSTTCIQIGEQVRLRHRLVFFLLHPHSASLRGVVPSPLLFFSSPSLSLTPKSFVTKHKSLSLPLCLVHIHSQTYCHTIHHHHEVHIDCWARGLCPSPAAGCGFGRLG